jgi:hypothetical protein
VSYGSPSPARGALLLGRVSTSRWARAPAPAGPGERPCEATDCRVHACETALRRLGERLDELARGLPSADGRLMARVMRDALVGREGK